MDKKILSTAIAGVLAGSMAFAANADVTLYGQIDLSMDALDIDGAGDDINMNPNTPAFGIKGSEDLGNGLKGIFQLEYQADPTGTANSASSITAGRDQWLGLKGSFGKVRLGTASTSYKAAGATVDPVYRTSLEGRNHGLQSRLHSNAGDSGQGRMTNGIFYSTPDFSGLSASAEYSFDDSCNPNSATCANPDDDAYGFGAQYKNGPALAFVSYVTNDKGREDDAWKAGGSYGFGAFKVFGQYEVDGGLIGRTVAGTPGSAISGGNAGTAFGASQNTVDGADLWHLGGSFTMGNAMLYAAYGQGDDSTAAENTEYDAWTIGGMYNLSKRTLTYAGFNQVSCDAGGWANNANTQCFNVSASGGEVDLFTIGMRHKF